MSFREIIGNLKHGDPSTHISPPGSILVDPATNKLSIHDGVTPGGSPASSLVKLASGAITTPVAYFDLALPSGYSAYQLLFGELMLTGGVTGNLAYAFSANGGTTFYNDTTNGDSYVTGGVAEQRPYPTSGIADDAWMYSDVLGYLCDYLYATSGAIWIIPGKSSTYTIGTAVSLGGAHTVVETVMSALNSIDATVPITSGSVNLMRVLPYGNGDCNPPTSGQTFASGSYTLLGVSA